MMVRQETSSVSPLSNSSPVPFRKPGLFFELKQELPKARHDFLPKTEWLASHSHEVTADS